MCCTDGAPWWGRDSVYPDQPAGPAVEKAQRARRNTLAARQAPVVGMGARLSDDALLAAAAKGDSGCAETHPL
ncbi:hypothetical protein GCM10007301_18640 [Azorhizobium oxalatiphilum]|uniref:Uncharacterized protein n=1 Tax=Azorhizobium oxalatiphilum TaxID=980631 RepID=A0A917BXY4_9HYPH|nr:hypothetical protein GCM10007301_18640 [Azorhizobium oxalatiphilum]